MKGKASRRAVAVALIGAAMLATALPADAASRICRQLQAELAGASGGRGQPRMVGKYDDAIDRQRGQIDKARRQARRAGCFFSLFGSNASQCAMLNAAIDRMGGNLDKLQKRRAKLTGGGSGRDRQRILVKLDANGCNGPSLAKPRITASAVGDHGSPGAFQPWLGAEEPENAVDSDRVALGDSGDGQRVKRILNQNPGNVIEIAPPPQATGEFRTTCVRTCDGYFFPMSNAATLGDFERDQKNCESSCPGADMQVFYSRGLDGDSADMTSASTGQPYSALPTAYLYKRTDMSVPQCGCRAAGDFSIVAGSPAPDRPHGGASAVSSSIVSFPAAKSAKAPTATVDTDAAGEPAAEEIPLSEEQRNVRVVGPRFLPDPAEAIDLRAPARTKVP